MLSSVEPARRPPRALLLVALAPLALLVAVLLAPGAGARRQRSPARGGCRRCWPGCAARCCACATACASFASPRRAALATAVQLGAWALQWLSLLAAADGARPRRPRRCRAAAAAVLFAVNVTAVIPATPANVGVFQAACVAVLAGAYHVSTPEAIAYGIVLQAVEVATALIMGLPALLNEGLSWREVRLRTMHAAPVKLGPLPERAGGRLSRRGADAES